MRAYNKYLIKEDDEFNSANYPNLINELTCINKAIEGVPNAFQTDILISYTKNHSLQLEWIKANPELTELVTYDALPISNMEALFEASHKNSAFRHQFEAYLISCFCC